MKLKMLVFGLCLVSSIGFSQDYFPKNDGVKVSNNHYTALTNATIYTSPTEIIEKGTLLLKNGQVVAVGKNVQIPLQTVVTDLSGKTIYPSFIDLFSDFGVKKPASARGGRGSQYEPTREGFYWNDHIMPENNAIDQFSFNAKAAKDLMSQGFGVVNTHIQDGVARGSGALIALNAIETDAQRVLSSRSAQYFSFSKSIMQKSILSRVTDGGYGALETIFLRRQLVWKRKQQYQRPFHRSL